MVYIQIAINEKRASLSHWFKKLYVFNTCGHFSCIPHMSNHFYCTKTMSNSHSNFDLSKNHWSPNFIFPCISQITWRTIMRRWRSSTAICQHGRRKYASTTSGTKRSSTRQRRSSRRWPGTMRHYRERSTPR